MITWGDIFKGIDVPRTLVMFRKPPQSGEYICYYNDVLLSGADELIKVHTHSVTIEVYSQKVESEALQKLSDNLVGLSIAHSTSQAVWVKESDIFLTLVTFTITSKGGLNNDNKEK